jgi:hypothetical protein
MIDEKKLLEWIKAKEGELRSEWEKVLEYRSAAICGELIAYDHIREFIESETAKLKTAHARIDRSRKSNAKPVDETFVFPLTVEGNAEWDAQKKMHEAANEIKESRVKVKMFPDRSCLPCRSDEIEG